MSKQTPETSIVAIGAVEVLAAQFFVLEDPERKHAGWWHQAPLDVQEGYREKARLQIAHWARQGESKVEELYDFDDHAWKRWMLGSK
jgi:hypothetical protein